MNSSLNPGDSADAIGFIPKDKGDRAASSPHRCAADDRRLMMTTITVPLRQGGAAIELPAATAGETVRLLVLIPQRM